MSKGMRVILRLIVVFSFLLFKASVAEALVHEMEITPIQKYTHLVTAQKKKIILIAGNKSHGPGAHEYLKSAELIKQLFNGLKIPGLSVDRGCGIALLHFSLFADDELGEKMLEWVGGYFDWQGSDGSRQWYSALKDFDTEINIIRNPRSPMELKLSS